MKSGNVRKVEFMIERARGGFVLLGLQVEGVVQVEGVNFKTGIEFLGLFPVFSHADTQEVDVRSFLAELLVELNQLGNRDSAQSYGHVVVVENFALTCVNRVDVSLIGEAYLTKDAVNTA